jgi:hypothetical protein
VAQVNDLSRSLTPFESDLDLGGGRRDEQGELAGEQCCAWRRAPAVEETGAGCDGTGRDLSFGLTDAELNQVSGGDKNYHFCWNGPAGEGSYPNYVQCPTTNGADLWNMMFGSIFPQAQIH